MARRAALVAIGAAAVATAGVLLAVAGSTGPRPAAGMTVMVTTSMLEAAVAELAPPEVEIVRLMPPGACPGHFDVRPGQVEAVRRADLLLRHPFQEGFEDQLARAGALSAPVAAVGHGGSLLIPANYRLLLEEVAAALPVAAGPDLDARLDAAVRRAHEVEADVRRRARAWEGRPVIAAVMQAEFCRWLGLEVVGTVGRPEEVSPRELEALLALEPELVVANLQSGTRAAEVLSGRLGVPLAVMSNFPASDAHDDGWEALVEANLERMAAAWAGPAGS